MPTRPVGVVVLPQASAEGRTPYASPPVEVEDPNDLCHATPLQWLVGRDRSEIPVPVDLTNRRVACTTCPRTEAHSPYLLNILYDAGTNRVTEVSCG
ncbi:MULTISPECIES: hypothetical protein [unclassified Brevundimonas]|jgi:hypothetical protein|uniref:hypothetical protein n=1 Tax=unclassified Brevundimonas TaxID=2622653 RepID=UPI00257D32FF|nr:MULTISPECIES: hypothetical protein [unclassified Brevundimonas]|tara:strand:- start:3969 stop:4259 length:291 start_codon:yes stop_codon:yes gene_type:complete